MKNFLMLLHSFGSGLGCPEWYMQKDSLEKRKRSIGSTLLAYLDLDTAKVPQLSIQLRVSLLLSQPIRNFNEIK